MGDNYFSRGVFIRFQKLALDEFRVKEDADPSE